MARRITQFLDIEEVLPEIEKSRGRNKNRNIVGQLGGSRNDLHNIIDVVVFNSALSGHEVKDFVKDYGLVIVDECHHVAASSFENVLSQVTAKNVFGLSATPVRQDGKHPIVFMQCGPIIFRDDARKQAEDRPFSHILLNFHCNAVIIDQRILWYGSLAPLGFGNENDSIMRIESPRLSIDMQSILIDNRSTNDPSQTPGNFNDDPLNGVGS